MSPLSDLLARESEEVQQHLDVNLLAAVTCPLREKIERPIFY
jgi:hypothetical protein